jgi:hypothetical protein
MASRLNNAPTAVRSRSFFAVLQPPLHALSWRMSTTPPARKNPRRLLRTFGTFRPSRRAQLGNRIAISEQSEEPAQSPADHRPQVEWIDVTDLLRDGIGRSARHSQFGQLPLRRSRRRPKDNPTASTFEGRHGSKSRDVGRVRLRPTRRPALRVSRRSSRLPVAIPLFGSALCAFTRSSTSGRLLRGLATLKPRPDPVLLSPPLRARRDAASQPRVGHCARGRHQPRLAVRPAQHRGDSLRAAIEAVRCPGR